MSQVLFPGRRFTDTNGNPINGGKLYVYEAGTTTPLDTYTDSALSTAADNPIVLDSAGLMPVRYVAPDEYKFVLKSSDDATTYWTIDNLTIIDPSTASAVATTTITSNTSVAADDIDRLFYGNTASGDVTITADSATLGSGFLFHAKKSSSDTNSLIVSGTGGQVIDGNSTFTLDAQYDSATFISLGAAGWAVLAQTIDTATLVSDNAKQRIQVALHCGRFEYSSATVCKLMPYNGTYINFPNGDLIAIPAAGVSTTYNNAVINGTAAQTLSASTFYYAYVYNDSGTLVIDWSTTAPAWDSTTGIRIKTGDDTRVLVGCAYTNGSSQFDYSGTKLNVSSWRNRKRASFSGAFTTTRALSSTSYVEVNSEIRCEFVTWGEDAVMAAINAQFSSISNSNQRIYFAVSFDGSTSPFFETYLREPDGLDLGSAADTMTSEGLPAAGHHYVTVIGKITAGSCNFTSDTRLHGTVVV